MTRKKAYTQIDSARASTDLFVSAIVESWFGEEMFRTDIGQSYVCTSQQTLLEGTPSRVGLISVNFYDTQVEAFRVNATNTDFDAIGLYHMLYSSIQYNIDIYNIMCTWSVKGSNFCGSGSHWGGDGEAGLQEGTGKIVCPVKISRGGLEGAA